MHLLFARASCLLPVALPPRASFNAFPRYPVRSFSAYAPALRPRSTVLPHYDLDILKQSGVTYTSTLQRNGGLCRFRFVPVFSIRGQRWKPRLDTAHNVATVYIDDPTIAGKTIKAIPHINSHANAFGLWLVEVVGEPSMPVNRLLPLSVRYLTERGSTLIPLNFPRPKWLSLWREAKARYDSPSFAPTPAESNRPPPLFVTLLPPSSTPKHLRYRLHLTSDTPGIGKIDCWHYKADEELLRVRGRLTLTIYGVPPSWAKEGLVHDCQLVWDSQTDKFILHERDLGPIPSTAFGLESLRDSQCTEPVKKMLINEEHMTREELETALPTTMEHYTLPSLLKQNYAVSYLTSREDAAIRIRPAITLNGQRWSPPLGLRSVVFHADPALANKQLHLVPFIDNVVTTEGGKPEPALGVYLLRVVGEPDHPAAGKLVKLKMKKAGKVGRVRGSKRGEVMVVDHIPLSTPGLKWMEAWRYIYANFNKNEGQEKEE